MKQFEIGDILEVVTEELAHSYGMPLGSFCEVTGYNGKDHVYVRAAGTGLVHSFSNRRFRVLQKPLAPPKGRKDDSGKLDMTLLDDMPRALRGVVEVMQWANVEKKPVPYERGSWLGVEPDRYRAAVKRHDRDSCEQVLGSTKAARFQRDKETQKLHLAHIATSALMALELVMREEETQ